MECCGGTQGKSSPENCPLCGRRGHAVESETLDHHVLGKRRKLLGERTFFCATSDCESVYFSEQGGVVRKGETAEPVTVKDKSENVKVCYCFNHTRQDLRRAFEEGVDLAAEIKKKTSQGECDCQRNNPAGICCLGNIKREWDLFGKL